MKESCKETFLLERLFQGKFSPCKILARCLAEKCINLQDLARKSCKILVRNAFFFSTREGFYRMKITCTFILSVLQVHFGNLGTMR